MNLEQTIQIYGGGPGSGCQGPNCGRPETGRMPMPRGRQSFARIHEELGAAARQRKIVLMEYQAPDAEKAKTYLVEPYSYRGKDEGLKFFGYDLTEKSIKAFTFANIVRVNPTGKTYKPRWDVELGGGQ